MTMAAPRPCTHPGCGRLVHDGSGRCDKHPRQAWAKKPTAAKRMTGRRLQRARAELFARNPLCAECERQGRVRLATQRDHKIPLEEGGTDTPDNEQGLCDDCHEAKSLAERLRARGLAPAPPPADPGGGQKSGAPRPETERPQSFCHAQVSGGGG